MKNSCLLISIIFLFFFCHFAEFARWGVYYLPKYLSEKFYVFISYCMSNVGYKQVRFNKKAAALFYTRFLKKLIESHTGIRFKACADILEAEIHFFAQLGE